MTMSVQMLAILFWQSKLKNFGICKTSTKKPNQLYQNELNQNLKYLCTSMHSFTVFQIMFFPVHPQKNLFLCGDVHECAGSMEQRRKIDIYLFIQIIFFCAYINDIIWKFCSVYIKSTWLCFCHWWMLRNTLYPIPFQPACVARLHGICLWPAESTLQPPLSVNTPPSVAIWANQIWSVRRHNQLEGLTLIWTCWPDVIGSALTRAWQISLM